MLHAHAYFWAQKKPRCYIGRGGKVRTCPKGRCELGNDQELFCGQKKRKEDRTKNYLAFVSQSEEADEWTKI